MNEVAMRRSLKITAAVGALALLTGLAGCSSSGGADQVLTVWTFKQSEVKALEVIGKAWGAKNHMTVKISVYTPDTAYATKVQSAAKSHTLPDIVSVHSETQDWTFAEAGIVEDLTKDFTKSWQSQFLPGVISSSPVTATAIKNSGTDPATTLKNLKAGHFYSVPYLAGTPGVVFASKKALAAAGISTTTPPSTWQQWISDIKKTTANDATNGGIVTGLQVPETGYYWVYRPMAYAYMGASAFYDRQGKSQSPSWDSATSVKTLDLYNQLTPLWSPGVLGLGIDQADQAFASGKADWDVGGTFTLSSLTTFGMSTNDVMVFPVPAASGGALSKLSYQASPLVGGSITTSSKHKAQALSFLKYATSTAGAETFAKDASDLPATTIPASSLSSPLMRQLVGLVTPTGSGESFNPNDFSADPAGTIAHDTAVKLTELPSKSSSVSDLASSLSSLYKAAWTATK
jgi:ABC-type glycerol-3-phosphate transport system substrate-binding protein